MQTLAYIPPAIQAEADRLQEIYSQVNPEVGAEYIRITLSIPQGRGPGKNGKFRNRKPNKKPKDRGAAEVLQFIKEHPGCTLSAINCTVFNWLGTKQAPQDLKTLLSQGLIKAEYARLKTGGKYANRYYAAQESSQ